MRRRAGDVMPCSGEGELGLEIVSYIHLEIERDREYHTTPTVCDILLAVIASIELLIAMSSTT